MLYRRSLISLISNVSYIVDKYSPKVAFGVNKLSSTATNCIRVRRDSDNAEQDIGFSGNDLDTASLLSFVGSNNGAVTKWYNQGTGGATYDFVQTTTSIQPVIVSSGSLVQINGKPSLQHSSNRYLSFTNTFTTGCTLFAVTNLTTATGTPKIMFGQGASGSYLWLTLDGSTSTTLYSGSGTPTIYVDGVLSTSTTRDQLHDELQGQKLTSTTSLDLTSWTGFRTNRGGNNSFDHFQAIILFDTDESGNRASIETNINDYYSIY